MRFAHQFTFGEDLTMLFEYLSVLDELEVKLLLLEKMTAVEGTEPVYEIALKMLRELVTAKKSLKEYQRLLIEQKRRRQSATKN